MKYILLVIALSLAVQFANGQIPDWAWAKNGPGGTYESGSCVAVDAKGNSYFTGFFTGPFISFDNVKIINKGSSNFFIVKFDPLGNVIWAKGGSGNTYAESNSISVDALGNSYITGDFNSDSVSFDGISLINSKLGGYNTTNFFIAKYDSSGNVLWAQSVEGTSVGQGITSDAVGNLYVTGYFFHNTLKFGTTTLVNKNLGSHAIFIAKYNANGSIVWAKGAGGDDFDYCYGIAVSTKGNLFITGGFNSTSIIFNDDTLINADHSGYYSDMFIVKYDTSGSVLWAKREGGYEFDYAYAISIDTKENAYITGTSESDPITFGNISLPLKRTSDFFVVKYDASGNALWANNDGIDAEGFGIGVDTSGNSYITGDFQDSTVTFGSTTLTNANDNQNTVDVFVVKYDSSGNTIWAKSADGMDLEESYSLCVHGNDDLYITGKFNSPTAFFGNISLDSLCPYNLFMAKLAPSILTGISSESKLPNSLNLFPNPSNGLFTLTTDNQQLSSQLIITNLLGKQIYSSIITSCKTQIDLSNQAKSIYFYRLQNTDKNAQTGKIVIE